MFLDEKAAAWVAFFVLREATVDSVTFGPDVFDPLLDSIPDNALVTDRQGRLVRANLGAQKTFGLSPGQVSRLVTDFFLFQSSEPTPDLGTLTAPFEDIFRKDDGEEIRVAVRVGPAGAERLLWLLTDLSREQDDRQHMIDFMADLTTAQARIREYTRQIEVFQKVVDGLNQGILLTDADERVSFMNAVARTLFGVSLQGRTSTDLRTLISTASKDGLEEITEGEVLILDEAQGRQTRCYLHVSPLSPDNPADRTLVWSLFELTEEISNTQAFIDYSAELADLNRRLQKKNEEIFRLSRTDVLTGVSNRRAILEMLEKTLESARTSGDRVAVVMLDIDRFKRLNDTRGHLMGDQVIRQVASIAQGVLGARAHIGRYGGEEFLLVVPPETVGQVQGLAEAVRAAVERDSQAQGVPVTVTLGVASSTSDHSTDALLAAADAALYRGKESGRNKVVVVS